MEKKLIIFNINNNNIRKINNKLKENMNNSATEKHICYVPTRR